MKLMSNQVYSTGRRKNQLLRFGFLTVLEILLSIKKIEDYFPDKALRMIINQPLEVAKNPTQLILKLLS